MTLHTPRFARHCLGGLALLFAASAIAQPADPVLDRVQKTGVFRMGYNASDKPFAFVGPQGKPVGYAIEMCERVAAKVATELNLKDGLKLEYKEVSSADRIPWLSSGKLDIECGASTNTMDRQKSVAFSFTYFVASGRMLVNKKAGIVDYRDLKPTTRVVVVKGTTGQQALAARLSAIGSKPTLIEVESESDAENLLSTGKADAYVMDDVLLYAARGRMKEPAQWTVVGKNLTVEPYGLMLPKGATRFEALVDSVLRGAFKTGEVQDSYRRWFQTADFDMPLSHLTRESFKWPNKTGADKAF